LFFYAAEILLTASNSSILGLQLQTTDNSIMTWGGVFLEKKL